MAICCCRITPCCYQCLRLYVHSTIVQLTLSIGKSDLIVLCKRNFAPCHLSRAAFFALSFGKLSRYKWCLFFRFCNIKMPSLISTLLPLVIALSIAATGIETNWSMFSLSVCLLLSKLLFHITFNLISFLELLASPNNQKVSFRNVYT